jgi:hypothetical protein
VHLEIDSVNIYGQEKCFDGILWGKAFKIIKRFTHILWFLRQLKTHERKRPNFNIRGTATDLKILRKKKDFPTLPFIQSCTKLR